MVRDTKRDTKNLEKCGFLAFIMILFFGTIFGVLGAVTAHFLMKHYEGYYIILAFAIVIAIGLGFGTHLGARIGRCSRLKIPAVVLILFLSVVCYSLFLFLNYYYDIQEDKLFIITDEFLWIAEEVQNFVGELPYVSDYIQPVENSERGDIGTRVTEFVKTFPEEYKKPVIISDIAAVASVKDYLVYPGITLWDEEKGQLAFDDVVQKWMLWAVESVFLLLIVLLITRSGTKKVYRKRLKRPERIDVPTGKVKTKVKKVKTRAKKEKKGLFGRKKKEKAVSTGLDLTPTVSPDEDKSIQPEQKAEKKKKKGGSLFRRKKKAETPDGEGTAQEIAAEPESAVKTADTVPAAEPPEDQESAQYALILHQYDTLRESDLVQLIQHVSQVPEEKARRLLKVPSLLKRDVSTQEARIAIEKFNQVQAQVKLITMERLLEIQQKQQSAPSASQPSSPQIPSRTTGDRYALILRKFDPAQRKPVLELLSSLSGTPVVQLQQSLKTPALILRDATKDEVTMIAQQFQNLQAEIKSLTMADLQNLMTKK